MNNAICEGAAFPRYVGHNEPHVAGEEESSDLQSETCISISKEIRKQTVLGACFVNIFFLSKLPAAFSDEE